jgi:hypothetical protein
MNVLEELRSVRDHVDAAIQLLELAGSALTSNRARPGNRP